jgi:hypothetical protein
LAEQQTQKLICSVLNPARLLVAARAAGRKDGGGQLLSRIIVPSEAKLEGTNL